MCDTWTMNSLVGRLAVVQDDKCACIAEETMLKAELRRRCSVGTTRVGELTVVISPNRRFNSEGAAKRFPFENCPQYYTVSFDPKRAKMELPNDVYDECMEEAGENKVMLR